MAKNGSFEKGNAKAAQAAKIAGFQKGIKKVDIVGRLAEHGAFIENSGKEK